MGNYQSLTRYRAVFFFKLFVISNFWGMSSWMQGAAYTSYFTRTRVANASYSPVKSFLENYKRPFTLIEVNPENRALSFDIAYNFNCTGLIIESSVVSGLIHKCSEQKKGNLMLVAKRLDREAYHMLADCEHFDVALIRNYVTSDYSLKKYLSVFLKLADYTIIESVVPKEQDYQDKDHEFFAQLNATLLSSINLKQTDRVSNYYLIHTPKTYLRRKRWEHHVQPSERYTIKSTFESKEFIHPSKGPKPWEHGINLYTFAKLKGAYPERAHIYNSLLKLDIKQHNDPAIGNMIIKGRKIVLIDHPDCNEVACPGSKARARFRRALRYFAPKNL